MENAIFDYCLGEVDGDVLKEFERNTEKIIESGETEYGLCTCDIFFNLANAYLKMANKYYKKLLEPFECVSKYSKWKHGISGKKITEEQQIQLKKIFSAHISSSASCRGSISMSR